MACTAEDEQKPIGLLDLKHHFPGSVVTVQSLTVCYHLPGTLRMLGPHSDIFHRSSFVPSTFCNFS